MLIKKGLVDNQNGCIVTVGDRETIKLKLAAASRSCFENGVVLKFVTVQKSQVLIDAGTCLKLHTQCPLNSILDA